MLRRISMRSWKDYNVLRESTPVEDRDRIAAEMEPLKAMYDPELARRNLKDRSYNRNENRYASACLKLGRFIKECAKNLGADEKSLKPEVDGDDLHYGAVHFTSRTAGSLITLSLGSDYFYDEHPDVDNKVDFIRSVAQGAELLLVTGTLTSLHLFQDDMNFSNEFTEVFKDLFDRGFIENFSPAQTRFMIKLIAHCQDGTDNSCRALKACLNNELITMSAYSEEDDELHLFYNFKVSSKMDEREKTLLTQAMKDIVDFTKALNCEE